jgi:LPS-assembly protein
VTGLAALISAGLLAQAGAPAPAPAAAGASPLQVEADAALYDGTSDTLVLTGGVRLRRGDATLRAPEAVYQGRSGEALASGGVLVFQPGRATFADRLRLLDGGAFEAWNVTSYFKQGPVDLSGSESIDAARRAGRNRFVLGAEHVEGPGGDRFFARSGRLTLCDCGGEAPSWEIRAWRADVVPGDRAMLTFPVLWVTPRFLFIDKPVPVLPLPWLYVPLGDRQTGLLLPDVHSSPATGWSVAQPLFLTLGRSWDATLAASYMFGPGEAEMRRGARGVVGPGGSLELRWRPAEETEGSFHLFWIHDRARDWARDAAPTPGHRYYLDRVPSPEHGDRVAVSLRHQERLAARSFLVAEIGLVNDPTYVSDFTSDVLLGTAEYRRSAVAATWVAEHLLLEADAAYHEPLRYLGQQSFPADPANRTPTSDGAPRVPFGLFGSDVLAFHRLPAASATLLPLQLAGPLQLSAFAGVARFAPLHGATGDEGAGGLGPGEGGWSPFRDPVTGEWSRGGAGAADGRWEPGERLAAARAALRAELRAPLAMGRLLLAEPWVRGSWLSYAFAGGLGSRLASYGTAGLTLSTQLERVFGSGDGRIRHVLEPRVEWRAGSGVSGGPLPAYAYDELDGTPIAPGAPCTTGGVDGRACLPLRALSAVPQGPWSQMRVAVRNRLLVPAGSLSRRALDLDIGQDLDLSRGALSESFVRAALALGPFRTDLVARFRAFGAPSPEGTWPARLPSWLDHFTEIRGGVGLNDGRGNEVHLGLLALGSGASGATRAGLEPLFDPRSIPLEATAQGSAGGHARILGGLDLSYEALFNARSLYGGVDAQGQPVAIKPHLQQQSLGLSWDSPCKCFKVGVGVRFLEDFSQGPYFSWILEIGNFSTSRVGVGL